MLIISRSVMRGSGCFLIVELCAGVLSFPLLIFSFVGGGGLSCELVCRDGDSFLLGFFCLGVSLYYHVLHTSSITTVVCRESTE